MSELTAERARELLDYDPITGVLSWKKRPRGKRDPSLVAGTRCPNGYTQTGIDGRRYRNHRLAWLITHGSWPVGQIDHRNGKRDDNRMVNLRDVPRAYNQQNQRAPRKDNSTGFLGVSWHARSSRFRADIHISGKQISLGSYSTPEAAHAAYVAAKRQIHAGNTL